MKAGSAPRAVFSLFRTRVCSMAAVLNLMSRDDWIYTGILGSSFLVSWLIRQRKDVELLKNVGGPLGFAMAIIILGWKIFYSIPLVMFAALCIKLAPSKQLTSIVFVGTFVYLMLVRYLHYFVDVLELASQANVVQLILTLRVIGLAFEVSDARFKHTSQGGKVKRYLETEPNLWEIFNYFYHFCGLFTGPYYTYQMFLDSQDQFLLNGWSPTNEIKTRALRLCWSVPVFVIFNKIFPLDGLRSDAVWEMSFAYRMLYAAAVFLVFRTRVYSAWAVSESMCVTLGIGIYPEDSRPRTVVGPADFEKYKELKGKPTTVYNSEAIVNLDIPQVEISDGFRAGIRSWNKSVQSWLAIFVHSRANKLYRVELTMFVSALWHGTYAGYFMSFMIVPMCAGVEDIIFKYVPVDEKTGQRPAWFKWIYIFTLRSRGFDMMATGFLLKNFADTHRFWSSLYYWLLLVTLPIYIAHKVYVIRKPKRVRDTTEEKATEPKKRN